MQQQSPKPQVRKRFSQESERSPSEVPVGGNFWLAWSGLCSSLNQLVLSEPLDSSYQLSLKAGLTSWPLFLPFLS